MSECKIDLEAALELAKLLAPMIMENNRLRADVIYLRGVRTDVEQENYLLKDENYNLKNKVEEVTKLNADMLFKHAELLDKHNKLWKDYRCPDLLPKVDEVLGDPMERTTLYPADSGDLQGLEVRRVMVRK